MARYTGAACKLCRRAANPALPDQEVRRRSQPYPPGEHGRGRVRETEYLIQLREKQKLRYIYGVLEKQFRNYYKEAARQRGITGENLLRILESRLDNVVYRAVVRATRASGPPVGVAQPLPCQRQAGRYPLLPGSQRRRDHPAGTEPGPHRHPARPRRSDSRAPEWLTVNRTRGRST